MGKISDFPLGDYVNLGFDSFVETGTGTGSGVAHALNFKFNKIHSCEIDIYQVGYLRNVFKFDERVLIQNLESPDFLHLYLKKNPDSKNVFWLDAHFPSADLGRKAFDEEPDLDKRLPLEKELDVLYDAKRFNDIIIIDDLRIYEEMPENKKANLREIGLQHLMKVGTKFLDKWNETHNVTKIYQDTGYILMIPKSLAINK